MIRKELFKNANDRYNYVEHVKQTNLQPGRNCRYKSGPYQHLDHEFTYNETQVNIQRYGKHGRKIDEYNNISINYPRQAFGTAIYNQFRQLNLNYIARQKQKHPSTLNNRQ